MTTTIEVRAAGRLRDAWVAAHHPVPGVPRWARNAAYAVPYTVPGHEHLQESQR